MPKNTSISLDDRHAAFIESCVKSGDYASADEVIRAGLHLLEEHEAEYQEKVKALNEAIEIGEASGPAKPFDIEEFKTRARAKYLEKKTEELYRAKAEYQEAKAGFASHADSESVKFPMKKSG